MRRRYGAAVAVAAGVAAGVAAAAPTPIAQPRAAATHLIFASNRDGDTHAYAISPAGGRLRALTVAAAAPLSTPKAPPLIVFIAEHSCADESHPSCFNAEVAVVAGDGTHFHQLTHNHVNERLPAWSADHRLIAYVRGGPSRIWVMDADGSHQRPLHLRAGAGERLDDPAWSPDGRRLAVRIWTGTDYLIFIYDVATGKRRQLRAGFWPGFLHQEASPEWSPDGTQIAFDALSGAGQQVYIASVGGQRWRRLSPCSHGESCSQPSWSPDGRRIAYSCDGHVCVTPVAAVRPVLITRSGSDPRWSPGGHWIAFAGSYGDIYVVRPDGTRQHRVAKRSPDQTLVNTYPDW